MELQPPPVSTAQNVQSGEMNVQSHEVKMLNQSEKNYIQSQNISTQSHDSYGQSRSITIQSHDNYSQSQGGNIQSHDSYGQSQGNHIQSHDTYGQSQSNYIQSNDSYGQTHGNSKIMSQVQSHTRNIQEHVTSQTHGSNAQLYQTGIPAHYTGMQSHSLSNQSHGVSQMIISQGDSGQSQSYHNSQSLVTVSHHARDVHTVSSSDGMQAVLSNQQTWSPNVNMSKIPSTVKVQPQEVNVDTLHNQASVELQANLLSRMQSVAHNTDAVRTRTTVKTVPQEGITTHTHVMPPSVDHAGYVSVPDKFGDLADVFQSVAEPINEVVVETAPSSEQGFQCSLIYSTQQISTGLASQGSNENPSDIGQTSSNSAEESELSFEDQSEPSSANKLKLEELTKAGDGSGDVLPDRKPIPQPSAIDNFNMNRRNRSYDRSYAGQAGTTVVEVHHTIEGESAAGKSNGSNVLVQKVSHLSKPPEGAVFMEDLTGRPRVSGSSSDHHSENEMLQAGTSVKTADGSDEETVDNADYFLDQNKALEIDLKSENQPMKHRRKCKATVKRLTGEELQRKVREPVRLSESASSREPIKVVLKRRSKRKSAQLTMPKRERSQRQRHKKELPPSHVSQYDSDATQEASEADEEGDAAKEENIDEDDDDDDDYVCKISKAAEAKQKTVSTRQKKALKTEKFMKITPPSRRIKEDGTPEKYTIPDLVQAVDAVFVHGVPITHASRIFGIPRKTLDDHVKGRSPLGKPRGPERTLSHEEEQGIVKQLETAASLGMTINRKRVRAAVLQMTKSLGREIRFSNRGPSDKWLRGFYERNPNLLEVLAKKPDKVAASVTPKPPAEDKADPGMKELLKIFAQQCAEEQKPKKRGKHYQYSTSNLHAAIVKVKVEGMAVSQAAKKFNVPRTTLKDHVAGKPSAGRRPGPDPTFSDEDEESLVHHIEYLKTRGFGVSRKEIRSLIMELLNKTGRKWHFREGGPSDKWFRGFYERYPHLADKQQSKKNKSTTPTKSTDSQWFKKLSDTVAKLELSNKPSQIFNCSEIGFAHRYQPWEVATEGEVRVHMCVSAVGSVLPSMIVYEKSLPEESYADECSPEWKFGISENGHMTKVLFSDWFNNIFLDFCGKRRPLLLMMENQDNLMSIDVLNQAKENEVEIIGIPNHLKRIKSPLESGIFNTIKMKLSELATSMNCVDSTNTVLRHKFPMVFSETLDQACMPAYIKTVFRKSGIYPLDASVCNAPLVALQPSTTTTTTSVAATPGVFNLPAITTVANQPSQSVMFDGTTYNSCALQQHVPPVQHVPPPLPPPPVQIPTVPSHSHAASSLHPTSAHVSTSHLSSAHLSSSHLTTSPHISTSHASHIHHASHLPTASQLASSHLSSASHLGAPHLSHIAPSVSQLTPSQLQYYAGQSDTPHPPVRNLTSHVPDLFVLPPRQYNDDQSNRAIITSAATYTEEVMPRPSVVLTSDDYLAEMVAREDAEKRAVAVGMVGMHNRHMLVPQLQTQPQQQQPQQQQQQQHLSQFAKKRMKLN